MRPILISGANGSLGQSIAEAFLAEREDNFVWLGVHHRHERVDALREMHPERVAALALDVTEPGAWSAALQSILDRHQRLDVLVNNAGFHEDSFLATMPAASWERVLSANLDSVFHGCRAVLPAMISQRGGAIVNIASLSGLLAPPGQTNYAAAKAGVLALTQSLAKEVARIGITVNAVCPGYIETEQLGKLGPEERKAALARVPMRRFGQPTEVAAAVRFLACPAAAYITGSVLKIDGGIL